MSDPFILHGDIEAACIAILMDEPELEDFPGGAPRISSDLVGYHSGDKWLMVSLEGGHREWLVISRPRVDVQAFASTRTTAHDLAQVAEAALFTARGLTFPEYGLVITSVKEETGLFRASDSRTGEERYTFSLRFCIMRAL